MAEIFKSEIGDFSLQFFCLSFCNHKQNRLPSFPISAICLNGRCIHPA